MQTAFRYVNSWNLDGHMCPDQSNIYVQKLKLK